MKCLLIFLSMFIALLPAAKMHAGGGGIDSLRKELLAAKDDTQKVHILDLLSFSYSRIDPDSGILFATQEKELAEQLEWEKGIASAHAGLAVNYLSKAQYAEARQHNLKAIELYEKLNLEDSKAAILANLSKMYLAQSRYPEALDHAFQALEIKERLDIEKNRAIILENIGTIYLELKNYAKAIEYYDKAVVYYKKNNNLAGVARNLGNEGIVYDAKGEYTKALETHLMALKENEALDNRYSMQINMANIAIAYGHLNDHEKALHYHAQALEISKELKSRHSMAVNMGNLGDTYLTAVKGATSVNNRAEYLQKAIHYLQTASDECLKINFLGPLVDFSQSLSEAYALSGDFKNALAAYEQHDKIKDSVFSQQHNIELLNLENKRETALKEKDIIIKDKQLKIAELQARNKRNERILYIVAILLMALLFAAAIRRLLTYQKRQRHALMSIADLHAHDIRGPVASILGLSELFNQTDSADPMNKELVAGIRKASLQLDNNIKKVIDKTSF